MTTPPESAAAEPQIHSTDVPQEDNLGDVRRTVQAVADGFEDTQSIAERTHRSSRHAGYAINAAITLGWIDAGEEKLAVLETGRKLLAEKPGSAGERALLRAAVEGAPVLLLLAPGLLAEAAPEKSVLCESIERQSGLSKSTAGRRAQTLLSWRRQLLEPL